MAYLEVETREGIQHVPLDRPRLTIGRLPTNDLVLPYQQISRYHAELRQVSEAWWIADLHSTNGLRVRGERVERRALRPGERVFLAPGVAVRLIVPDEKTDFAVMPTTRLASIAPPPRAADAPTPGPMGATGGLPVQVPPPWPYPPERVMSAAETPTDPPALPGDQPPDAWPPSARTSAWLSRPHQAPPDAPESADAWRLTTRPEDSVLEGDLFRRRRTRPSGPVTSPATPAWEGASPTPAAALLHLCQTCGQLTAPEIAQCQSCHSSIARPCRVCALPLLPVQDRCPRCQEPNAASILRMRRGVPDA